VAVVVAVDVGGMVYTGVEVVVVVVEVVVDVVLEVLQEASNIAATSKMLKLNQINLFFNFLLLSNNKNLFLTKLVSLREN
jgi:hypothetical protein